MSQETFLLQLKFNLQKKQTKKKTIKVKSLATMLDCIHVQRTWGGGGFMKSGLVLTSPQRLMMT